MGEAHAAVADDPYAAYWNPAGLASILYPSAGLTYNSALEGVDQQYLSVAYPVERGTTLDLNLTRLGMSSFQGYDAQGVQTRKLGASDYAVGLALGRTVLRDEQGRAFLNLGANLKAIREQLDTVSAQTFAADLGAMVYLLRKDGLTSGPDPGLRLAFTARNIGPGLKFDRDAAPLPATYAVGAAWRGYPRGDALTASADIVENRAQGVYAALGVEYTAFRMVALRVGYRTGQDIGMGFRAGVGFKLKVVEIDYAFAGFGDLGTMHRAAITARFGGPVEATSPEELMIRQTMERGQRLMNEGRFYEAVLQFDEVLKLDPGNRKALELMRQSHDRMHQ